MNIETNIVEWSPETTVVTEADVHALLAQLRTGLTLEAFRETLAESRAANPPYRVWITEERGRPVAYMGGRIITDFVHGRHLYIDDLVVDRDQRSRGLGAALLKEAERIARAAECRGLRLCTGIDNEGGRKFYEREGWFARAFAFKKKL